MRGRARQDEELKEFIAARTEDLHHDAYQLTAAQETAEQLVVAVLADMRRERVDLAQAGATARLRMARTAARHDTPTETTDVSQLPTDFHLLARLSPRQRAVLLLQVVYNYDDRGTARELQLSSRATTAALQTVPYDELPGATPHSGELRSLLEAFGDLATSPSAAITLADMRAVPPPPRRPWWTYVAALLVIVLTVSSLVITQGWHNDWLKTADGLNHTHGTHFPAYTQGFKLVDIHDVAPGPAENIRVGPSGSVALECDSDNQTIGMAVSSELTGTFSQEACPGKKNGPNLTPAIGTALVSINNFSRDTWPVAVYRSIPLSEYPIATSNFDVQDSLTLGSSRKLTSGRGKTLQPVAKGTVLTIHGSADHPNGTFTGTLQLPAAGDGATVNVVGLLSPTTTGRYRVRVNHHTPWTTCGTNQTTSYEQLQLSAGCSLVDQSIPQVTFNQMGRPSSGERTPVEITVTDARGAWTLQVVADSYKLDAGAVDDGANG